MNNEKNNKSNNEGMIKIIQKYDTGKVDNKGQIIIDRGPMLLYTGMMYDDNRNIVPWKKKSTAQNNKNSK